MQDKYDPQAGYILCDDDKRFNFYLDNYCVTFMCTDDAQISLEGVFVFGQTYGFRNIAIYKGKDPISFTGIQKLNTGAYIVATENGLGTDWNDYDYIEFRGGTLNSLFFCNGLKYEWADGSSMQITPQNDEHSYGFKSGNCACELVVRSISRKIFGLGSISISNNEVELLLKFDAPQSLENLFEHIRKVMDILSIMTFRKNINFDEIYLCHNNRTFSKMQVFLKNESPISSKNIMQNITFHDLGEKVSKLAAIVFNSKDKQPAYEIGYFPASDKDIHLMNNEKVRLICSALECELSFVDDLKIPEEQHLQELIKEVVQRVKDHQKGSDCLSPKTYDLIFSSIGHWSMSASDKICQLYHRYEKEIAAMMSQAQQDINVGDKEILEFIKYRNNITHGSYRIMEQKIADTAFVLEGLAYCCFLVRIGMTEGDIMRFGRERKILF